MTTVLIVEDEPTPREFLHQILAEQGYETDAVENLASAQDHIDCDGIDIVLLDVQLPDGNGLTLLEQLGQERPGMPVIVLTGYGDIEMAVEAMQLGAQDFMAKPINAPRLMKSLERAAEAVSLRRELAHLRRERWANFDWVPSQAPAMKIVSELVERAAPTNANVLVGGESGTGKEVVAHALHTLGPRIDKAFVAINCAAIPEQLLESELFGHEANAFTGAAGKRKKGLMEVADGGTLFLDEISTMKADLQAKLLRAIEERVIRRVGGISDIKIDIRLVVASNRDLSGMVASGEFRDDLYWRLKVVEIQLPPLRKRREDIPAFVGAFIRKFNVETGKNVQSVQPRAMEALKSYHWPGNIRELRNVIERAMLFCDDAQIELGHLPAEIHEHAPSPAQILQPTQA